MAMKRIKKDQVDAGKKELPRKLQFLDSGKVAYSAVLHNEEADEWFVELPLASVKKLARSAVDLKELKSGQKALAAQAAQVPRLMKDHQELTQLRETSAATDADLKKALRRVRALEKELGLEPGGKVQNARPAQATQAATPAGRKKAPTSAGLFSGPASSVSPNGQEAPVQASPPAPAAGSVAQGGPKAKLKPLAKAAKKATDAPGLPEHSASALPMATAPTAPAA